MEYSSKARSHILCIECLPEANIIRFRLVSSQKQDAERVVDFDVKASHQCVDEVIRLLRDQSIDVKSLVGIAVVQGASRFTIARVVAVTVNALSVALDIPVRDYDCVPAVDQLWEDMSNTALRTLIHPRYSAEPHITYC